MIPPEDVAFERGIDSIRESRYADAERRFTEALRIHPGDHDALQRRAFVREQRGRLREAAADYRAALARFPRCRWCLEGAADVQVKLNRHAAALRFLDRALRVDPRNASFRLNRGFVRMILERHRGALADFDRVSSHRRLGMLAIVGRAQLRALVGNLRASLRDFDRAIRMRSGVREHHFYRGMVRFLSKDVEGAREDFKQAGLGPSRITRLTRLPRQFRELLRSGEGGRWLKAIR